MEEGSLQAEVMKKVLELWCMNRMSQDKRNGKVHKRKEESKRKVHRRDEEQTKQLFGGRHERNDRVERYESGRDGSTLEEAWLRRSWKRRFWTSARWRTPKEVLAEAEAQFWNGVVYEEAGSTEYESGEKTVGQEFSLCSENTTCSVCEASRRSYNGRRRDEAAAKNGDYE